MRLKDLKLLAGRPELHHGPRQKVPFGSGGDSQLQTLVRGAARAALPKEGAVHLLPSGKGRYRNSMVHRITAWSGVETATSASSHLGRGTFHAPTLSGNPGMPKHTRNEPHGAAGGSTLE